MRTATYHRVVPVESRIREFAAELSRHSEETIPPAFESRYLTGRLLRWAMQDPGAKVNLFRLVDVLPTLHSGEEIRAHIAEMLSINRATGPGKRGAVAGATGNWSLSLAARILPKMIEETARQFIAGDTVAQALPKLETLFESGIGITADLLGEATVSQAEADACAARYRGLIDALRGAAPQWRPAPRLEADSRGAIPRANVSLKLSALESHLEPADPEGSVAHLKARVLPLLLFARETNTSINIDMESWALHGITLDFFEEAMMHPSLRDWPHMSITVQSYLKTAETDMERLLALARRRRTPFTVRLVKGAYWDRENLHARQHGYPIPVWPSKAATDEQFERLSVFLLKHCNDLMPAFGTHNLRSIAHARAQAEALETPVAAYEFQMLYGMAEPLRDALVKAGHRVRVYCPIGALLPGMSYLVRRLLENTSDEGFLRQNYVEHRGLEAVLARPVPPPEPAAPGNPLSDLSIPFSNVPQRDFTNSAERAALAAALEKWPESFPLPVPICVSGTARVSRRTMTRVSPNDGRLRVAEVALAEAKDVAAALEAAAAAWPAWRDTAIEERARRAQALAMRLWEDRARLAALEIHEVGKPWAEADADVTEAIDYCLYYARRALIELAPEPQVAVPGEANHLYYEGRGPTAIIAPWNFPLAILCGMSVAALVSGNPVLLKPAEQSSAIGYLLYEHLLAAGFPPEAVHFLPGKGEVAGRALAEHPLTAQVAFTGGVEAGLAIRQRIAVQQPGQRHLKRMICEMGGKNAIIIDNDADLDEAVQGVMTSAFGYAGQKCSACSRVLALADIFEPFTARLIEACRSLAVAPASEPGCQLGPVIDRDTYECLMRIVRDPGPGAEVLFRGDAGRSTGYFVPPLVVRVQDPAHALMQEELFGPILCLMRVDSFEEALAAANSSLYALTGGVYTRRPSHIEQARRAFRVGNLYINRGCTGAMVGRQPFGGFQMSGGGDAKAGGPGYLLNFTEPQCVTENLIRRGFAPEFMT